MKPPQKKMTQQKKNCSKWLIAKSPKMNYFPLMKSKITIKVKTIHKITNMIHFCNNLKGLIKIIVRSLILKSFNISSKQSNNNQTNLKFSNSDRVVEVWVQELYLEVEVCSLLHVQYGICIRSVLKNKYKMLNKMKKMKRPNKIDLLNLINQMLKLMQTLNTIININLLIKPK